MPSLGGSGEYGGDDPTGGASIGQGGYSMFAGDYGGGNAADIADPLVAFNNARNQMNNPGGWDEGDIGTAGTGDIGDSVGAGDITGGLQGQALADMVAQINQAVNDAMPQSDQRSKLQHFISTAAKTIGQLLGGRLGAEALGAITDAMIDNYNLDPITAEAITGQLAQGQDPASIIGSLSDVDFNGGPATPPGGDQSLGGGTGGDTGTGGDGGTGGGGDTGSNDPLSYDFWNNFVDEWMGKSGKSAKDMVGEDDAFKKSQVEPAIGKYQAALADLTNQAQTGTGTFTPTTFGMGNFRSSFVPKSGHLMADKLKDYAKEGLTSSLALTDVMQPNKGSMDYLDQLKTLAMFDKGKQMQKYGIDMGYNTAIDSIQEGQEDKGSWLDIIKDVVKIGDTVGDTWTKYF